MNLDKDLEETDKDDVSYDASLKCTILIKLKTNYTIL